MQLSSRRRLRGISIVELMVTIAISLLVVLAGIQVYVTTARGGTSSNAVNRFNQDLRATMQIMIDELRRAGAVANPIGLAANPFTTATTNLRLTGTCALYAYDATWNGGTANVVDAGTDFGGFQFAGNALQFLRSTTLNSTNTDCSTLTWDNVTDPAVVRITALTFDYAGSKCIAFDPATYNAAVSSTFQTWTLTGGTTPACDPTVTTANGGPATFPALTNTFVEVRTVRVVLSAQHATDPTITGTVDERVTLRNDRVITP